MTTAPSFPAITLADIESARARISRVLEPTPLARSAWFSERWGGNIWFKFENLQRTGSFKERGALNRLLCLSDTAKAHGVITASAGNHGQAVACHARRLGIPATVVMPLNSPLVKVSNTAGYGAETILHGASFDDAVEHARRLEQERGLTYVHGFDDPDIIAGQGTIGLELVEQCPELDEVVVPVGGGGLIAGVALALKARRPQVRVTGVQFEHVPSMIAALEQGTPVTVPPHRTIADGIAVRRVGQLPLEIVRHCVDQLITVSESEIANAILLLLERERTMVEGAGAVGVAALENGHVRADGRNVVVLLSGGNIDVNLLSRIIDRGLVKAGRLARLRVTVPDAPGQLARVLDVVAELRANILEISHSRAFSDAPVGETVIDLVLETHGPGHIEQILGRLRENGVRAEH